MFRPIIYCNAYSFLKERKNINAIARRVVTQKV